MTKLYKFQKEGVRLIEKFGGRVLLADQMGLGKTLQTLKWIERHPEIHPIVVTCPASVKFHWEAEAKQHIGMRAEVLSTLSPPTNNGLVRSTKMFVINYDIARAWVGFIKQLKPQLVIIDEGHYCANPEAKRSRAVWEICRDVPHVIVLTGTPFKSRPIELFFILNILWPKKFRSRTKFGFRYCKPRKVRGRWQYRGAANMGKLHKKLLRIGMIRRLKAEVLQDLPKKTRHILPLDIDNRKEYEEITDDFTGWVKKNIGPSAAIRAERSEQISRMGYLKRMAALGKMPYVIEWIDSFEKESNEKLVIVCIHKKIVKMLKERFPNSVVIDGSVTGRKRKLAIEKFRTDKKVRFCIGNMQAMGTGTDGLQIAQTMAIIELGWTPGEHSQLEARIDRIGQRGSTSIHYLIARNTIEEWLCQLIQIKQEHFTEAFDGGVSYDQMALFDQLREAVMAGGLTPSILKKARKR